MNSDDGFSDARVSQPEGLRDSSPGPLDSTHPLRQRSLVRDAIVAVVRRLDALPPCVGVSTLRAKADAHLLDVEGWLASGPAAEERDRLMKHVLHLHVAVAKLERATDSSKSTER